MNSTWSFLYSRVVLLVLVTGSFARAQSLSVTGVVREAESVTLNWRGGHGPYLIETSADLVDWSDQGELVTATDLTLLANASAGYYRVRDLGASGELGPSFGLIQTEQGEFGDLLGRHRLKSRWWLDKPQGALAAQPAAFFRRLIVHYQFLEDTRVRTFSGSLEGLGSVATPGNARQMTVTWIRGAGSAERKYILTLDFPYDILTSRATEPKPSDPTYKLRCDYATSQPTLDAFNPTAMGSTLTDSVNLIQLAPPEPFEWLNRKYTVRQAGASVDLAFREGNYLRQGSPLFILKTYVLQEWMAPTRAGGGRLPTFTTDSYFARTLFPFHHNFIETVLIEPGADPALSEVARAALVEANIRYVYTLKDIALGSSPDTIRLIGYDNTIRLP
jgi:hypothetical protein